MRILMTRGGQGFGFTLCILKLALTSHSVFRNGVVTLRSPGRKPSSMSYPQTYNKGYSYSSLIKHRTMKSQGCFCTPQYHRLAFISAVTQKTTLLETVFRYHKAKLQRLVKNNLFDKISISTENSFDDLSITSLPNTQKGCSS